MCMPARMRTDGAICMESNSFCSAEFNSPFFLVCPLGVGMADEAGIAEPGFVGDFASEPGGSGELAVGRIKFDFRDDQPLVFPGEFVDLPHKIAERNVPAAFEDDGLDAESGKKRDRILDGDGVFELGPGNTRDGPLDGEAGLVACDAGAHGHAVARGEVPLLKVLERGGGIFPGEVFDEEFAFDFEWNGEKKLVRGA